MLLLLLLSYRYTTWSSILKAKEKVVLAALEIAWLKWAYKHVFLSAQFSCFHREDYNKIKHTNVKNYWFRCFWSLFHAIFWCLPLELRCCSHHHGLKYFPHCLCHFKHSLSINTNQNQEVSNCAGFDFVNTKWKIKMEQ